MKEGDSRFKKFWKKFWFIVWKDDSLKGWIISVIFLFIIIKFIFFPVLNLATGTPLPLVIVESCSMYHEGNFGSDFNYWWEEQRYKYEPLGIEKQEFKDFLFTKGFNKGDILFVLGAKPEKLQVGDIIIFQTRYQHPIIHRIIRIKQENGEYIFSTEGDNNQGQLPEEKEIHESQIIGKAVARPAPYLGWIKLVFFEHQKSESQRGSCSSQ